MANMNSDSHTTQLTPLQKAAIALLEMRARLDASERSLHEPIAIVGMACRLPGGIGSPQEFWRALVDGVDLLSPVPSERWDAEALYHPTPGTPGKSYVRHGYFLRDADQFDPFFFEMSPREAKSLDPQQRLLLEVSWQALQDAQYPPERLSGSQAGVFIGIGQNDYAQRKLHGGDPAQVETFDGTGNGFCFAAGRVSHWLGLRGPNLAVDTACSSSLVALHLACQSLRLNECGFALAGGVQFMASPRVNLFLSQAKALAPDGRSKSFDAAADGFGRGEGCGVLALKRLSDAQRDGDRVLAVVRGSAVNHDGRSSGLTVPNAQAQQAVVRSAMKNAGVAPDEIDFIEAHGTGTALGDPIEARAIDAVFQGQRERPLWLSSVKANIGHLEAAAGVAGVIKTVLCLQHQQLPKQLLFQTPSPHIDWSALNVRVADHQIELNQGEAPPCAGVSSFGISGTNCHVVLSGVDRESALSITGTVAVPFKRQRYWLDEAAAPSVSILNDADALLQRLLASGEFNADEQQLLPKVIEAIQAFERPLKENLYETVWREEPLPDGPSCLQTQSAWLLLSDAGGVAAAVEQRLKARGQHVVMLPPGGDLDRALDELGRSDASMRAVLYFGALDAPPTDALTVEELQRSPESICGSMRRLLQAVAKRSDNNALKIWAVTQCACALPDDKGRVAIAQAPLHGFGKAAALEFPEHWGGLIDLGDGSHEDELNGLLLECAIGGSEMIAALRGAKRFVARLASCKRDSVNPILIDADATYWTIGGLGALGLQTAQWLVERGARSLVLTNRSGETEQTAIQVQALRAQGAVVHVWRGDVCDAGEMQKIVDRIQREAPSLKGVIHAAGAAGYQSIENLDETQMDNVMRSKTLGAWNLLNAVEDVSLDFILLYSSIASVWGSKNQSHYAAANHFLDALACDAAKQGCNAHSINWGPWPGDGMATESARDLLSTMGITPLSFKASFAAIQRVLSSGAAQTVAADVDWPRLSNLFEIHGRHRFFEELIDSAPTNVQPEQSGNALQTIEALADEERLGALRLHVQTIVADLLGYEGGQLPDAHDGFFQLGMDSLLAVDLKDRLVRSLGVSLAAPAVFSYPNAHDLAAHIFDNLGWSANTSAPAKNEDDDRTNEPVANEPDDALAKKLAQLESLLSDE
ncbi:MAG: SDR family NAD(P)-dependent oxidoreductase [Candidatus Hinthialibacter antarcticus]|nr:SDR family NAD(P)-dependent oxidoreductase [Candidatus Hinthialibacter antarcticus]